MFCKSIRRFASLVALVTLVALCWTPVPVLALETGPEAVSDPAGDLGQFDPGSYVETEASPAIDIRG